MKSSSKILALCAGTAATVLAWPHLVAALQAAEPSQPMAAAPLVPVAASAPRVEVVFVLDTTSSMGGLIDAAKENIWSIAQNMASAQPTPEFRMGLVAFRDRGDDYVTRVSALSADLDSVYATLMDFRPEGGGDGPESVNAALHAAVHQIQWNPDPRTYKVIFLVGDAPPHMDYQDDVPYPETLKVASRKGIVVNTILAGHDVGAAAEWKQIAALNQGAFFEVGTSGNAVAVATPFDAEIAALSAAADHTRLFFGNSEQQAAMARKSAAADKLHAASSAAAQARRAAFNVSDAGAGNKLGENELVDAVSKGKLDLAEVKAEELPEALRDLDLAQKQAVVQARAKERAELDSRIGRLSAQRQAFIDSELAKREHSASSLDAQIHAAVRSQAKDKGLRYEAKAVH